MEKNVRFIFAIFTAQLITLPLYGLAQYDIGQAVRVYPGGQDEEKILVDENFQPPVSAVNEKAIQKQVYDELVKSSTADEEAAPAKD